MNRNRIKAIVAQFAQETAIANVGVIIDTPEVRETVIEGIAVDMVHREAGFDSSSGGHPDGMRDIDVFALSKRMLEL